MQLLIIFLVLSGLVSGLGYYFSFFWRDLSTLWMPFVFFLAAFLALVILFVLWTYLVSLFIDLKKPQRHVNHFAYWIMKEITEWVFVVTRVRLQYVGEEKIPLNETYLLVCNHVSGFDHLCFFGHLKGTIISVTKKENEDIVDVGKWMHLAGFLPLDRQDPYQGLMTIGRAIEYVKTGEASVAISPEGTRSKDGSLLPFHDGSFKIATKTGCPVVVCRLEGTNQVKHNFPWHHTVVKVTVLAVYHKEDYEHGTAVELSEKCHDLLASSYQ
jgi:1-acyl-sn-glycerol-3-phosphate acyltransferase